MSLQNISPVVLDPDIRPKENKLPVGPRVVRNLDFPRCTYNENLPITKNPNATGS
ncbi:putative formamidase [Helianthus annuus]|nr:putative formamidase [Helianthus annuus]KAJ0574259.1 putative formamidase [Helianthus annuus]KAJ0738594.1 putative formamidase [Helianthus annuus]